MRLPAFTERNHQQLGAVEDPFDLECQELVAARAQRVRRAQPFLVDQGVDIVAAAADR